MQIKSNIDEIRKDSSSGGFPRETLVEVEDKDIKDGTFEVPSEVSEIGKFCFYKCKTLKKVIFPDNGFETIECGAGAFYNTTIEEFIYLKGIMLCPNSFTNCLNLKKVILPNCSIGPEVFSDCKLLETVDISNVWFLSRALFKNCESLKEIIFSNLYRIESGCFENCSSLINLTIPKSIHTIEYGAFYKCNNLNLVIETSLFNMDITYLKKTFDVKSLTIYNNEINLSDSIENIKSKLSIIRRKEIDTLVKNMMIENNLNINDISKHDLDKINEKKEKYVNLLEDNCNADFCRYINEILQKYKKNLPTLNSYNLFISKPTEEIYNIINSYNPNVTLKTKDDIQKYGSELVFFPTYITSSYLDFVRTRNDYNETIIKMKDVIDRLTKNNTSQSLIKKIFLRKVSNKNKLELNTEFINDLNNFIDANEVNLSEESMFLENLKKLIEVFINKLQMQYKFILNYNKDSLSPESQVVLSDKLSNLEFSITFMEDLSKKIDILCASNIIIYNKLELLKNTILPKIIMDLVITNKIEANENTINALNSFSNTLEEVIILNEENKEVLKIYTNSSVISDEKDYSKKKIKN